MTVCMWGIKWYHVFNFSVWYLAHIPDINWSRCYLKRSTIPTVTWHLFTASPFQQVCLLLQIASIVCSSIQPLQGYAVIVGITSC